MRQAIGYFQQAIDRDPNYALAYSGLADCYSNLQGYAGAPPSEMLPRARAAALRALEIDASLAEAHASLGYGYAVAGRRSEALAVLKELEDRYARGEAMGGRVAWIYAGLGDKDQAFASLEREFQGRGASLTNAILIFRFLTRSAATRATQTCSGGWASRSDFSPVAPTCPGTTVDELA